MKQAQLNYSCDECENEESPPEATWAKAKKAAREDGWIVGKTEVGGGREADICPSCKARPR